jgi:PTS system ascorbate-specific IIC component
MDVGVIFNIVPRLLPTFMLGLVALIGLLLQQKKGNEVIEGTIKTMVGVLILFAGVDLIVGQIEPIATLFGQVFPSKGEAITSDWVAFLGEYGVEIVLTLVFGFLVNLVIARFTKLKYVFLTGHILFWNAFIVVGALADGGKMKGVTLIIVGSIVLGFLSALMPALVAGFVEKLTGSRDFSIGHSTTVHAILGAWIGQLVGGGSESLEDVEIKEGWSFLKSMTVSTSLIMILLYLIMGFVAGLGFAAETFTGGTTWLWFLWIIYKGLLFGGGLTVLLTGVRMMLGEIIPAFHGLASKVVPEAVPALDCPMIFPYGQNSLAIGFPIAMVASMITLVIFQVAGYKYLLLPLIVAAFFDVGPGVILANATGGRRGALTYAILGGVVLVVLQAVSLPFAANTTAGFLNLFGGNDFSLFAIVIRGILSIFGL